MTYSGRWLKSTNAIKFEIKERIAYITLNRPEKRNAINNELQGELGDALFEADFRNDVNVVVLQGEGKDFCAGYDLVTTYSDRKAADDAAAAGEPEVPYRAPYGNFDDDTWSMERMTEIKNRLFDMHKPVIAKVHGNCLAGGTDLALLCDLVIAAEDARIGFPATRANGSPPSHFWLAHMGPQWAKRMLLTGDSLRGADAARLGLVLDAFPADQLDAEVHALAKRMTYIDIGLLTANKRIVNIGLELQGTRTLQRLATENDARAHLATGPRRTQFRKDMAEFGLKEALKKRDEPFGDGYVKLSKNH